MRIKPNFPIIELSVIAGLIFAIGITTVQILKGGEGYYIVYPLPICGLIFSIWFTNYRNKIIEFDDFVIRIRPFLGFKYKVYNISDFVGFEINRVGLVKQIRLIDKTGKKISFTYDAYNKYFLIIGQIKNTGLENLGEKEIKWRFKRQYGLITGWSFLIAMILFLILMIIERK